MNRLPLLLVILLLSLSLAATYNAPGDVLTLIQRPLLNIPAIVVPGETFTITCLAPDGFNTWHARLIHDNKVVPLQIISVQNLTAPARYELTALVPDLPVFELYDLMVNTDGGMEDISRNSVQVIPSRKTDYYFVHVTDTHMPGRTYYPDEGYLTDSTSVNDFRAVLEDINLIQPEFVLLTGDLINEGEMEGFGGLYSYGWAQRVLMELEVPLYLTSGNHDIGGWNATPPPQGSSRRNWWDYFGWSWLDQPNSSAPPHTQDYYFTYGDQLFVGMEAYINYDNWRSNIYGGQSFIYSQLSWLSNTLALYPDKTKVLFHHYDFSDQLNLTNLGLSMSLSGHTHSNSGSITEYPYDLRTRSTCDGNRAYRIIRVSGADLYPQSTVYAGSMGTNLNLNFYPDASGAHSAVTAVVTNSHNLRYENTLVKFRMPAGNHTYTISGGVIEQVDRSGDGSIVYVRVDLPPSTNHWVNLEISGTSNEDPLQTPAAGIINSVYPNPFSDRLTISVNPAQGSDSLSHPSRGSLEQTHIRLFNARGALVKSAVITGYSSFSLDGVDEDGKSLARGIYFLQAARDGKIQTVKLLKI